MRSPAFVINLGAAATLVFSMPAWASPITYDFTVTSCSNSAGGFCGNLIGTTFSTFTVENPGESNDYMLANASGLPHFSTGQADFSLSIQKFSIVNGVTCDGCSWTVTYIDAGTSPTNPSLTGVSFNNSFGAEINYSLSQWRDTEDLATLTVDGNWSDGSLPNMSGAAVPEPSSLLVFLSSLGLMTIIYRIACRWAV